jgi:hypothetical protein
MRLRMTIDVFSGRPNPVLELDGRDADEALARLEPVRKLKRPELRPVPESLLGYRGLIIEQIGEKAKRLPSVFRVANGDLLDREGGHRLADANFDDYICGPSGPIRRLQLGAEFPETMRRNIEALDAARSQSRAKAARRPSTRHCRCAPLYEPAWWNDKGQKQWNNNCYNYATDYRTDSFAQPGLAAGAMYTALACPAVRDAAVLDDLINAPTARNRCPKEGHLVALVVAPGWDFHWYRKGRNGLWTHKPGATAATNVDNQGALIPDPRSADRGPYTDFCTFMVVMHGHIKIR